MKFPWKRDISAGSDKKGEIRRQVLGNYDYLSVSYLFKIQKKKSSVSYKILLGLFDYCS